MRHAALPYLLAIVCATGLPQAVRAQSSILVLEAGSNAGKTLRCADADRALKQRKEPFAVCTVNRISEPVRCAQHTRASVSSLCASLAGQEKGALELLDAVARDAARGLKAAGGLGARQSQCPSGLPEGELLLPDDQLVLSASSGPLENATLAEDLAGAQTEYPVPGPTVNAKALRGHDWVLRGRTQGKPVVCTFTVLSAPDAQPLIGEYRSLTAAGSAGALDRAFFFRRNRLTYEYWRALDALR
jgi:hypothetical protein